MTEPARNTASHYGRKTAAYRGPRQHKPDKRHADAQESPKRKGKQ